MKWDIQVLTKHAEFKGIVRRSEYWFFVLLNFVISLATYLVDLIAGKFGVSEILYFIALITPGLALPVCRLPDTNRSGWNLLFAHIPIIGVVVPQIFFFQDSTERNNHYGQAQSEFLRSSSHSINLKLRSEY